MTLPYILVGEAPSAAVERVPSLWLKPDDTGRPHSANRLRDLLGMTTVEYLATFDRTNVLDRWPGRQGKSGHAGSAFPKAEARLIVADRWREWADRDLVLLGTRVAAAFGMHRVGTPRRTGGYSFFEWRDALVPMGRTACSPDQQAEIRVAVLPHPSGANRLWNDRRNRDAARQFADGLIRGATT